MSASDPSLSTRPASPLTPAGSLDSERELRSVLYAVSHDVRAPLRALDGFALALEEDYADRLDEIGLDYLHRIRGGAQRMDRMIESIVRLARLALATSMREHADVSHMAGDILGGLRDGDPGRAGVQVVIEPGLEIARCDRALVRTLLTELLSNAWKFTAEQASPEIRVRRGEPVPGAFTFVIEDNGVGFDTERAGDRLFGLFQRFHAPGRFPGEGAGLALVRRAALLLGGDLSIESQPGRGTLVRGVIPNHS